MGSAAPEASRSYDTKTDADGRYAVPALRNFPQGLTTRLARFSLVIYKKDYVGYRHNHLFNQPRSRTVFSQLGQVVKLTRWSPELSHAEHLLFIGGESAIRNASKWEVRAAVAELDGKKTNSIITPRLSLEHQAPPLSPPRLDAGVLLSSDEVRAISSYKGAFTKTRLPGARSESYDTFHLRAVDQSERYDIAIRLWRLSGEPLIKKYEEILTSLEGSKQGDEVGDRSFTVKQGEILGLGMVVQDASVLILLTCGKGQCTQDEHLIQLGKIVEKNIIRLPPFGDEDDLPSTLEDEQPESPSSQPDPAEEE